MMLPLVVAAAILFGWELTLAWQASAIPDDDHGNTVTYGMRTRRNRFGFRDDEFAIPKPAGVYRILVLGDSFTFGVGLAENDRYTEILEKLLQATFPKRSIEVLNAGISGGPTTVERDWLGKHIDAVQPDCVVIGFCVNDPKKEDAEWSPELDKWKSRLDWMKSVGLERFSRNLIRNKLPAMKLIPNVNEALDRSYARDSTDWHSFTDALDEIGRLCHARAVPVVFMSLLYENGDYGDPNEVLRYILKWTEQAEEAARSAGLEVVSVEPEFKSQGDKVRWVNRWDAHPSRECHEIYAKKLAKFLATLMRGKGRPTANDE